jgi:hypothetical protein
VLRMLLLLPVIPDLFVVLVTKIEKFGRSRLEVVFIGRQLTHSLATCGLWLYQDNNCAVLL